MNLLIDIGNTRIKSCVFSQKQFLDVVYYDDLHQLAEVIKTFSGEILLSTVRHLPEWFLDFCAEVGVIKISHQTALPIKFDYKTPETLGVDRLVAAAGAWHTYHKPCVVVDIGTCITIDFLDNKGVFLGGNISPGPDLRFSSMNNFTSALPLEKLNDENDKIGSSTKSALQIGVKQGIAHEIQGYFAYFQEVYPDSILVLTGGYSTYFDSILKGDIFAEPKLVFIGLKSILEHNNV